MFENWKHFTTIVFVLLFTNYATASEIKFPETVTLETGSFLYRASGEYLKDGYPINAPLQNVIFNSPITIMKYQVRVSSYEQCVADGYCKQRYNQGQVSKYHPVTGVSYDDAVAFSKWLSNKTDLDWRLPTDEEWSYAAGSRFIDDAINVNPDSENPATRWLAKYQKYADLGAEADYIVKPAGYYGVNENGIYDMSGNIWEWTDSCYKRTRLDAGGTLINTTNNCGVRISAGRHRAYISSFIQNAKGGGCSVGAPPDHLGFRSILEPKRSFLQNVLDIIGF